MSGRTCLGPGRLTAKQILFGSDRDGSFHIFRQAPDQTTPELLVGGSEQSMLPRLTPDGKHLVYLQYRQAFDSSNAVRMMRIPVAGGPPQLVMEVQGLTNEQCARQPSSLCLYSVAGDKRLTFMSFDPMQGTGQEVAHLMTICPTPITGAFRRMARPWSSPNQTSST